MSEPKLVQNDPFLKPYADQISERQQKVEGKIKDLLGPAQQLSEFANGHNYFGCQRTDSGWTFREWAPNANGIQLVGDRMGWTNASEDYAFTRGSDGIWELTLDENQLHHLDQFKLFVSWSEGQDYRLSPWTKRVVQDHDSKLFSEQIWAPPQAYIWKNKRIDLSNHSSLLIYEAHIGMSSEFEEVSTYEAFRLNILPYIAESGYNVIQLMAVQEHPYYGSFGYHVSNFFAPSSRFGTPDELKCLVDEAHSLGIGVIMDIVHSHAVKNALEGPGLFDGKPGMFFHSNERREHPAWDSLCFDYSKNETIHFLLSNCKYWLEEFNFDGFRFDGVTSMLFYDHGLERSFNSYESYFDGGADNEALVYLCLANMLIKEIHPNSAVIAEDMSGLPGIAAPISDGGIGFDYRLAMGVPDFWIKTIKECTDEQWNVNQIYHELTNKRNDEKVISYVESHDQALVGDKTIIFRLADQEMYTHMAVSTPSVIIDRALALHKMIRLITLCTNGGGYLNFMGNEFGHPEWIDFPREGNNWSYKHARRQWTLIKNQDLKYKSLQLFDNEIIRLFNKKSKLTESSPELVFSNENDQVIAIKRGDYIFIFNFNPVQSYPDYGIPCFPSDYRICISSDDAKFGGFNRINTSVLLESHPSGQTQNTYQLMTYLPSRTVQVIRLVPTPKIR